MNRRSILQSLAGLIGAKTLPAAKVKIPASLQVAKAAVMARPTLINAHTTASIVASMGESLDERKWHASLKERRLNVRPFLVADDAPHSSLMHPKKSGD